MQSSVVQPLPSSQSASVLHGISGMGRQRRAEQVWSAEQAESVRQRVVSAGLHMARILILKQDVPDGQYQSFVHSVFGMQCSSMAPLLLLSLPSHDSPESATQHL